MARNRCARVQMEEMYLRLVVDYDNDDFKKEIQNAISKIEKETKMFPSVTRRAIDEHAGNFSIEFDTSDSSRDAGEFCEKLMRELGIDKCSE